MWLDIGVSRATWCISISSYVLNIPRRFNDRDTSRRVLYKLVGLKKGILFQKYPINNMDVLINIGQCEARALDGDKTLSFMRFSWGKTTKVAIP